MRSCIPASSLRRARDRRGGIVRQRPGTAKGFVFVGLEDETGRLDVIIPPPLYEKEREIINGNGILAVRGRWERRPA